MTWIDHYPNASYAYEYELAQGFTPPQAAGIVGNLIQESGVNPESVQQGGPGRGIAQWSLGGRWRPDLATGNPAADLPRQLAYIMQELNSDPGYGLRDLRAATTPQQAAQVFGTEYERYGIAGARVQDAVNVYNALAIGSGAQALPEASVPTSQLTGFSVPNPLDPLSWSGGFANVLGGFLGPGASMVDNVGKFIAAVLYGGTWIRFGEALLGTVAMSGGLALIVACLASSPGTLSALGTVAALFPGEGTAASLAMKTAAGAKAAGGRDTTLSRFARGARSEGDRQRTASESRARTQRAEADTRESRRSREHVARHNAYQHSQTSYRRSLADYDRVKTRDAKANEDEELFTASRGQARSNRTGYRRHVTGTGPDRHSRGPIFDDH